MPFHMYTNYAVDILHSPPKQNQKDWASFYLKCDGGLNMTSFSALFPHILNAITSCIIVVTVT